VQTLQAIEAIINTIDLSFQKNVQILDASCDRQVEPLSPFITVIPITITIITITSFQVKCGH